MRTSPRRYARRRCQRQRASVDAQNRCDIFVRERKQVPDHAIVHGEKPARKARRYRVHPVAGDGLKVLKHNGINVEQGHATNRLTRVEKGGKPFGRHDQGSAPNLYLATADISTNDRQKAERALAASHGRLYRRTIPQNGHRGEYARGGKIHDGKRLTRLAQ